MPARKPAAPPQDGLLDLLAAPPVTEVWVDPDVESWGALNVVWTKPRAGRALCDTCTKLTHAGQLGSPPLAATTRRVGPNGELKLCPIHAQDARERDARVQRDHADRKAQQDHAARHH